MASMLFSIGSLLGAGAVLVTAGLLLGSDAESAPFVPSNSAAPDPIQDRTGEELFQQLCALCHGVTGDGDGIVKFDRPARSFKDGHFSFGNTREALFRTVTAGIGGTPMPGFGSSLTEDERYAVVDYIIGLGPEREVTPPSATVMTVKDRPLVVRGGFGALVEGGPSYPRGVLAGNPDGLSFQYDAQDVRLVAVRQGEFVDRRDWENRGGDVLEPLGATIHMPSDAVGTWSRGKERLWARLSATDVSGPRAVVEYELIRRGMDRSELERYDFTEPLQVIATVAESGQAITAGGWSGYRRTFEVRGATDVAFETGRGTSLDWGATLVEDPEHGVIVVVRREARTGAGRTFSIDAYFGLPANGTTLAALKEAL